MKWSLRKPLPVRDPVSSARFGLNFRQFVKFAPKFRGRRHSRLINPAGDTSSYVVHQSSGMFKINAQLSSRTVQGDKICCCGPKIWTRVIGWLEIVSWNSRPVKFMWIGLYDKIIKFLEVFETVMVHRRIVLTCIGTSQFPGPGGHYHGRFSASGRQQAI